MAEGSEGFVIPISYVATGYEGAIGGLENVATAATRIPQAMANAATATERVNKELTNSKQASAEFARAFAENKAVADAFDRKVKEMEQRVRRFAPSKVEADKEIARRKLEMGPAPVRMQENPNMQALDQWFTRLEEARRPLEGVTRQMQAIVALTRQITDVQSGPGQAQWLANSKSWLQQDAAMRRAIADLTEFDAATVRLTANQRELVNIQRQVAQMGGKQDARKTTEYRQQAEELQKLVNSEREQVAVDQLLENLAVKKAQTLAYLSNEYRAASGSLGGLTQEQRIEAEVVKQRITQEERLAKLLAMQRPEVQGLVNEIRKLEQEQRKAAAASELFNLHAASLNNMTASLRAGLAGVGMGFGIYTSSTIVAATATYSIIAATKAMITSHAEFSAELAKVSAVMKTTESQYEGIKQKSLELGAATRYTATEVASAFKIMGLAGLNYQESLQGIGAVLSLASIGNMDFAQATDVAVSVMYGFNKTADQLTHVVDVMAHSVTQSNQNIAELGNTMSYAAPIAQSFGISLEMAASMTEVLANAGIKASKAGTTLRRTLTALFSDTENVNKQLGELGVTVNTVASNMDEELLRVLKELNVATDGGTTHINNLVKAVGLYAAPGFLKLVAAADASAKSLDAVYRSAQNVTGAAYEMQKRMEDTLSIDWETLTSAIDSLYQAFGDLYDKKLRGIVQTIAATIQGVADNKDSILVLANSFERLGITILSVVTALGSLMILKSLVGLFVTVRAALAGLTAEAAMASFALSGIGKVLAVGIPGLQIVAAVAAIGAAIWTAVDAWNAFSDAKSSALKGDIGTTRVNTILSEDLTPGSRISKLSEAEGQRVADIKEGLQDLYKQRDALNVVAEVTDRLVATGGEQADAVARVTQEQEKLNATIKKTESEYYTALSRLLDLDKTRIEGRLPVIDMTIKVKNEALDKIKAEIAKTRKEVSESSIAEATLLGGGLPHEDVARLQRQILPPAQFEAETKRLRQLREAAAQIEGDIAKMKAEQAQLATDMTGLTAEMQALINQAGGVSLEVGIDIPSQQQMQKVAEKLVGDFNEAQAAADEKSFKKMPDAQKHLINQQTIKNFRDTYEQAMAGLPDYGSLMTARNVLVAKQQAEGNLSYAPQIAELEKQIKLLEEKQRLVQAGDDAYKKAKVSESEINASMAKELESVNDRIAKKLADSDELARKAVERTKTSSEQLEDVFKRLKAYQESGTAARALAAANAPIDSTKNNEAALAASKDLEAALDAHKQDLTDLKRLMQETVNESEKFYKSLDAVAERKTDTLNAINNFKNTQDDNVASLTDSINKYEELAKNLKETKGLFEATTTRIAEITSSGQEAYGELDLLNQVFLEQKRAMEEAAAGMDTYKNNLKTLETAALAAMRGIASANKSIAETDKKIADISEARRVANMAESERLTYVQNRTREINAQYDAQIEKINQLEQVLKTLNDNGQTATNNPAVLVFLNQIEQAKVAAKEIKDSLYSSLRDEDEITASLLRGTKDLQKSVRELKQDLWDLFNMPNQANFANTLKGQMDYFMKQSDYMMRRFKMLQGQYPTLPDASASFIPGGAYHGPTAVIGAGERLAGYTASPLSDAEYINRVVTALGTSAAGKALLAQYLPTIKQTAQQLNVDLPTILSIIMQESGFNPAAVNARSGATGLMQILPSNARGLQRKYGLNPDLVYGTSGSPEQIQANLMGGVYILKEQGSGRDLRGALRGYGEPTDAYVNSVVGKLSRVRGSLGMEGQAPSPEERVRGINAETNAIREQTTATDELTSTTNNLNLATREEMEIRKQEQVSTGDATNFINQTEVLRQAINAGSEEIFKLQAMLDTNTLLSPQQSENIRKQIESIKGMISQYQTALELQKKLQDEAVKSGDLNANYYTRSEEELKALGEGYDSAWARSRKYYMAMKDISDLEKAGYLTHTEAMLEKINADLANMDPLTKDMATNLVQAITDVATGASKSSDAVDNLKKSLKNLVMEKFVVKIGIDLIGTITQPISVGLQEMAGSILKGVGSMLFSGLGALASGIAGGFGSLGVEGSGNAAKAVGSTATGLTNAASSVSNLFSLGSSLLSFGQGAMAGINVLASSGASAYMGLVSGAASAGSYSFALGAAAPFLLPVAIGIGWAISKWFSDQAPRQGAFSATTFGGPQGLEDWQNGAENYSKGGFGLMFGLSDNGSKNIDASEFKEFFDAMAKTTQTMEDFYGPEVSKKVEEALKRYSLENWTKDGIMRLSMDSDQALRDIINMISDAAAATGDEVAQILDSLLGTLSGTAEEIAQQLETAMGAVEGILKSATDLRGTEIGDAFGLTGTAAENALKLVEFSKGLIETGETAVEAAQRVIGELGSLQFALDQTATSIEGLNQTQIAQLASDLADAYGSATKLAEAQAKYFTEFFSASEQATINMRRTLATLKDGWAKLQKSLQDMVGPKPVKIVIPELTGLGDAAKDAQKELTDAIDSLINFGDQGPNTFKGPGDGWFYSAEDLIASLSEKIDQTSFAPTGDGWLAISQFVDKLPEDKTAQDKTTKDLTKVNENAKAVLKAAEMYSRGVASGAIQRNTETEQQIQAAIDYYAEPLRQMGYDVTKGVFALADQIKNWAKTSFLSAAEQMAADNIKDPNAEIYARLVSGDLPKTRDEFNKLIGSINLQTEAGRTLYAELMKLVDAFDAMYDAIEGFESWLGVKDDREIAKSRLDKVFHDLGLQLPATKDALKQLYLSGKLTAEQLAILGANLEDLTAYYGNTDNWDPREDLTNATIARLQSQLDKFNEDLSKSRNIVQSASNALENLRKSATSVESYQEDIRVRARAALSLQRLPDDIDQIIQGLGNINQSDYGTYEDYMAAMLENDNLLRQIKLRAENQVSWDEKQVKLLQEQIDLQKEAILKERVELYEKIKGLEADLLAAQNKLANLWDTGIGATNKLLGVLQAEMQIQGNRLYLLIEAASNRDYLLVEAGFLGIAAILNDINGKIPAATKQLAVPDLEYEPVTAREAPDNADTENQMTTLIAEVHQLRVETRETQLALAATTQKQMDMLYRWEGDGLPPDREDYLRQIAYNTRSTATVSPCQ